ncbi:hypothetical protein J40TS1_07680 [Paenibacillus montaniterrae]|uniref:Aldolase n=1 Tax=Paenibacillus montaniterrae TaxID=429341 RepID=A0A920CVN0_9BACL|nr:hypothetical protein [Paenibacillus montaniterrae]GIP15126.1 hypothetical protein J40TS1_07680 [Paenibacillus montaniterrae]
MFNYIIYNKVVESEIELPCNQSSYTLGCNNDKTIVIYYKRDSLCEFDSIGLVAEKHAGYIRSYAVNDGILICASASIKIHINQQGTTITVDAPADKLNECKLFIIGIVFSICLIFQNIIPLHAAGLAYNEKSFGLMALSGSGKSTTLMSLLKNGFNFISDDVLPLSTSTNGTKVYPSKSIPIKLWKETLEYFDIEWQNKNNIIDNIDKFWVDVQPNQKIMNETNLSVVFLLHPLVDLCGDNVEIHKVSPFQGISMLIENTHGLWTLPASYHNSLYQSYFNLISTVPIYIIRYEKSYRNLSRIKETIITTLEAGRG